MNFVALEIKIVALMIYMDKSCFQNNISSINFPTMNAMENCIGISFLFSPQQGDNATMMQGVTVSVRE